LSAARCRHGRCCRNLSVLAGATFIVDDDTVRLHAALSDDGSVTGRALTEWAEHILKLSAYSD
jgi:hypothetical protein